MNEITIDDKLLAKAIMETILLWSKETRLGRVDSNGNDGDKPFCIAKPWFESFRSEWNLSRALIKGKDEEVNKAAVAIFNEKISELWFVKYKENRIQKLAEILAKAKLTPNANLQTSMVSKIAFFSNPYFYVPFDGFSRRGLRKMANSTVKMPHVTMKSIESYDEYVRIFHLLLKKGYRGKVECGCQRDWVLEFMGLVNVRTSCSIDDAFVTKVFDVYLMYLGGFEAPKEVKEPA